MNAILAQIGNLGGTVAPLRSPPVVEHLLLESPWGLAAGMIVAGAAALWVLNRSGRAKAGFGVLGATVGLAAGVVGLASLVTTYREAIAARTKDLVFAAATLERERLRDLLDPRVVVPLPRLAGGGRAAGIDEVLGLVDRYPGGTYPVSEHDVQGVQSQIDGADVGVTQTRVRVRLKGSTYDEPFGTWWRIDWQRSGDGPGRATGVKLLFVDGIGSVE